MQKIVRRLRLTLAPRDKALALIVEHRFDGFIFVLGGLENTLGLIGFEVEAVEERMVALGRRPVALEQDLVARLHQQRFANVRSESTAAAASGLHAMLHRP